MTKADLVQVIQEKTNCTKKDAERVLTGVFAAITDALAAGDKVTISVLALLKYGSAMQRNVRILVPVNRFRFLHQKHRYLKQVKT